MIFSSLQYILFLPLVVWLYWSTKGSVRLALVVMSRYFFYMSWLPVYGILLFGLTLATWLIGFFLPSQSAKNRKVLLWVGLLLNIGCLCYYKYANFFLQNLFQANHELASLMLGITGGVLKVPVWDAPVLNVILPLGISFFVFEFVHYIVDIYHGNKPVKSFMEFAAFAAFFPSQIAGPIKRYQDFIDKLHNPEPLNRELFLEAMTLIVQGLFKKVAISDPIGALIAGPFSSISHLSAADAFICTFGFFVQCYCDFSGYTDIGRGSALLMGIRLPENFRLPYLAVDIADFWRRWHMSLSFWLRDYLYIPLGGSRTGPIRNQVNLFITMAVSGLWHGANWHFVAFGVMNGIGLILNRLWKHVLGKVEFLDHSLNTLVGRALSVVLTCAFWAISLVLLRAPDMPHAMNVICNLVNGDFSSTLMSSLLRSGIQVFLGMYLIFWLVTEATKHKMHLPGFLLRANQRGPLYFGAPVRLAAWTVGVVIMLAARPTVAVPFVYFQF